MEASRFFEEDWQYCNHTRCLVACFFWGPPCKTATLRTAVLLGVDRDTSENITQTVLSVEYTEVRFIA